MTTFGQDDAAEVGSPVGGGTGGGDQPVVSRDALVAALWLVEAYVGDDEVHPRRPEAEVQAQIAAAGEPTEIVRAGAVMIGAMGEHIAERFALAGDVDPHDLAAAGLRRVQRGEHVPTTAWPLIEKLFTSALVERVDTLARIDALGPCLEHLGPVIEVAAALMDLIDNMHERAGAGVEIMTHTLDALKDST